MCLIVSDTTIKAEALGDFFKNQVKKPNKTKKMAKTVLKNRSRALDVTANISTAAAREKCLPKSVSSTLPEVINFYHTGKCLFLGNFVYFLLHKWNKKLTDYTRQHLLKIKILI